MAEQDLPPLSQGSDFVGELNAKLRDLRGFDTLANELIQNADDAKATKVVFDVRGDCLIVENNATFTECGDITLDECPWLFDASVGHKCDFHRFRKIAGADKRNEAGTTGAFGFGFVSVYQITNNPQVISRSHHWRLCPDAPENERIRRLQFSDFFEGTRFIFPWASDPQCALRKRLGCSAIRPDDVDKLSKDIEAIVPNAILFLRHLVKIEIKTNGVVTKRIERTTDGVTTTVRDGRHASRWHICNGNFDAVAATLRKRYVGFIEEKRTSSVSVAICIDGVGIRGLYFATLPTQHQTHLPIHINADFYPESNRKHLALGDGYEGAWNEAAINGAAKILADALCEITGILLYRNLWRLLSHVERTHRDAHNGRIDKHAMAFWEALKPVASRSAIVYVSKREWCLPKDALLLLDRKQEQRSLQYLEQLGLRVVHPDLSEHHNLLTTVGVPVLTLADLSDALVANGLGKPVSFDGAPEWLHNTDQHRLLSDHIQVLLSRLGGQSLLEAREKIAACSVARSITGGFCPPNKVRYAPPEIVEILEPFGHSRYFIAFDNPECIRNLVKPLSLREALNLLEKLPQDTFERLWLHDQGYVLRIVDLLKTYSSDIHECVESQGRIRDLSIWPANNHLHSLNDLVVPGDFSDPFGLATVVDELVVTKHKSFLIEDLQASTLTLQHYAGSLIPRLFESGTPIDAIACSKLISELAEHTDTLRDYALVQQALADCAFLPCNDGCLRNAKEVYFANLGVTDLLGASAHTAVLPDKRRSHVQEFLIWLGVASFPRPADVMARIKSFIQQPPLSSANRALVQSMIGNLGKYWDSYTPEQRTEFDTLRTIRWLPAKNHLDRWYSPSEVFTQYQQHLFETTGDFLDLSITVQRQVSTLIEYLRIKTVPTCQLVVRHLLSCATASKDVSKAVYGFLSEANNVGDPSVRQLKGQACLSLGGIGYVRPEQVFWNDHSFHPYLFTLSHDFDLYRNLLAALDVRDKPSAIDAIKVLCDIADGNAGKHLDDGIQSVIMKCWLLISEELHGGQITQAVLQPLLNRKVILNRDGYLQQATWMFFEDRHNLAERFGDFLKANVILRPPHGSFGMELSGVRPLSHAVKVALVDCGDVCSADELQNILFERRHLIERVISPAKTDDNGWNTHMLNRIQLQWSSRLEVGYTLRAFDREQASAPERADTYYDVEAELLYIQRNDPVPWHDIASGLAYAMNKDAEESTVSAGLFVALSAPTLRDGSAILNKLGFPPLQSHEEYLASDGDPVSMGGIDSPTAEDGIDNAIRDDVDNNYPDTESDDADGRVNNISETVDPIAITASASGDASQTPAVRTDGGSGDIPIVTTSAAHSTSVANKQVSRPKDPTGIATPRRIGSSPTASMRIGPNYRKEPKVHHPSTVSNAPVPKGRNSSIVKSSKSAPDHNSEDRANSAGRLRTYVFHGTEIDTEEDEKRQHHTEPIDSAGIERVLALEEREGRLPKSMPHNNPGYDIYSVGVDDNDERYIEVKSLSAEWHVKGVQVSAKQFNFAFEQGQKFWLYIVERAEQDDFTITRIQDPARRVTEFLFDDGWRACDDVTSASSILTSEL